MKIPQNSIDKFLEVLEFFDTERVAKVMAMLDWKWGMSDGELAVPSEKEIISQIMKMFTRLVANNLTMVSTGGLQVGYNKQTGFYIEFVITSAYESDLGDV